MLHVLCYLTIVLLFLIMVSVCSRYNDYNARSDWHILGLYSPIMPTKQKAI